MIRTAWSIQYLLPRLHFQALKTLAHTFQVHRAGDPPAKRTLHIHPGYGPSRVVLIPRRGDRNIACRYGLLWNCAVGTPRLAAAVLHGTITRVRYSTRPLPRE